MVSKISSTSKSMIQDGIEMQDRKKDGDRDGKWR